MNLRPIHAKKEEKNPGFGQRWLSSPHVGDYQKEPRQDHVVDESRRLSNFPRLFDVIYDQSAEIFFLDLSLVVRVYVCFFCKEQENRVLKLSGGSPRDFFSPASKGMSSTTIKSILLPYANLAKLISIDSLHPTLHLPEV